MNNWIWPRLSDKTSARKAIEGGVWACLFIIVVDIGLAVYALTAHQKLAGYYDAWVLVDGFFFAIIAWRLWKNSRTWAVIGLLLMGIEIADKLQNAKSTFGVVTVLLFLAILNATRGAFAFHKYSGLEPSLGISEHPVG